jgi:hypothetical protein
MGVQFDLGGRSKYRCKQTEVLAFTLQMKLFLGFWRNNKEIGA